MEEGRKGRKANGGGDSRTELVHAILVLNTGLVLSTSALCTNTTLAFFNFSGLTKSSILSRVDASDGIDPSNGKFSGSIPSRVSSGANSITLSTRSIFSEGEEGVSPPTLRIRWITPIDLLIASRSGSIFAPVEVVFVSSSHPPILLTMPRGGRLAVATSVQSPIIIRSSSDDDGGGEVDEEEEEAKEAAAAASDSNRSNSSRNLATSAGDVTKTFPATDLDERAMEDATRRSRAAARLPPSTATSVVVVVDDAEDESDEDDDDDDDVEEEDRRRGDCRVERGRGGGERNAADRCRPGVVTAARRRHDAGRRWRRRSAADDVESNIARRRGGAREMTEAPLGRRRLAVDDVGGMMQ